ncbi:hypothetical protein PBY51_020307 [Eleginops maclovinus]|uniref:AIG1-type G domain-containing protein n=2 Tax=Eleginops maclovinus TaxID=56733 RepID=A0AAN7XS77_ELEMC|nr:hypothetical protein PBY51_020307 [Eleginops maclovinus]
MSSISGQLSSIRFSGKKQSSSSAEVRLVLLGKTGSGKSSTANSILGSNVFDSKVSSSSVTQQCHRVSGEFHGRNITLLDTPGLLDTQQTLQEVQKELRKSISLLYPGPHAFLLVIQIGRFTQEEKDVVRQIKQAMGAYAFSFSVVVFTHGDLLEKGTSVKQSLIDGCKDLADLVAGCGGRYCVFNNKSSKNKDQMSEVLALVDSMMLENGGIWYSSKMLKDAEEELAKEQQEERRLMDKNVALLEKKQEAVIKELYGKQLEMVQLKSKMEMEELKKKIQLEKKKEEKLSREREEAFRREMEDYVKKEKDTKTQEMVRLMEKRIGEEEEKMNALQEKLDKVTKMLKDQEEQEDKIRRAMQKNIQKEREENEKKEREKEFQQIQKEQPSRQREKMRRDTLQRDLDKLTLSLKDQSMKEEDRKRQMEVLIRREREEKQRERDIQMENMKTEKRRTLALQQELKSIRRKVEQQKETNENLKRQLEENLRMDREKCIIEMSALKKQYDKKPCTETIKKRSAEKHSTLTAVTGFAQEMGLLGLNAALETVGAPCCIL